MNLDRVIKASASITLCTVLMTGCGMSERSALKKCEKLAATWGTQADSKYDLVRMLGVEEGKEDMALFKMMQHSVSNKEQYGEACMHVVTDHEHDNS